MSRIWILTDRMPALEAEMNRQGIQTVLEEDWLKQKEKQPVEGWICPRHGNVAAGVLEETENQPSGSETNKRILETSFLHGMTPAAYLKAYEWNVIEPICMLNAVLSDLDRGGTKKICFLTDCTASVNENREVGNGISSLTETAKHMYCSTFLNAMKDEGYSVCLIDAGDHPDPQKLFEMIQMEGFIDSNPARNEQHRLKMTDMEGREYPW